MNGAAASRPSRRRAAGPLLVKEVRALLPAWSACAFSLVAAGWLLPPRLGLQLALAGYAIGSIGLGAASIGHEYTFGTLEGLLAQPVTRRRVFCTKLAVLAAMIATLAALAWVVLGTHAILASPDAGSYILAVVLTSTLLAPVLTMTARSTMGGLVFGLAVPGALYAAVQVAGVLYYGAVSGPSVEAALRGMFWWAFASICAAAAAGAWPLFRRLQALDGRGTELDVAGWRTRPGADERRRRHATARRPIVRMIAKEIRLQQLSLVVSGLLAACLAAAAARRAAGATMLDVELEPVAALYSGLVALMIGASAVAEERHYGTLQTELLLPISASVRWAVKTGTALGLALLLGAGVPLLLAAAMGPQARGAFPPPSATAILVVLLFASSLYVSSVSRSGIRAMVMALPATAAFAAFVGFTGPAIWLYTYRLFATPARVAGAIRPGPYVTTAEMVLLGAGFVGLMLYLGGTNARALQITARRLVLQATALAAYLTAAAVIVGVLWGLRMWD